MGPAFVVTAEDRQESVGTVASPRARHAAVLVLLGALAAAGYLLCEAPLSISAKVVPLWNWGGLTHQATGPAARGWLALGAGAAMAVWLVSWWRLLQQAHQLRRRSLWAIALSWGMPIALGPPLLSLDSYAYVAQGRMVVRGLNPYHFGPAVLGAGRILDAVDPLWRSTPTPYGPLLLRVQAIAVSLAGGHPVLAVFGFRLLIAAALAVTALLAARLLRGGDRISALLLVPLNPVLLVVLLNGAHLDALMAALVVCALVLAARGYPRLGLAVAALAVAVKMPALVVVAAIGMADLRGRVGPARWRRLAQDGLIVVGVMFAASFAVPDGFGWLTALGTPAKVSSGYAPAELVADLVNLLAALVGVHALGVELLVCRVAFATAGAVVVGWLCLTVHRRGAAVTAVLGLLTVALAAPVFYGWYLAWGLLPAALLADRRWVRRLLLAMSAIAAIGMVPDLGLLTAGQRHLLAGAIGLPALVAVAVWAVHQRRFPEPLTRGAGPGLALARLAKSRRVPQWALGGLVAAGALSLMSAPAVAVPGSVREAAQLLSGESGISHAWLIGSDYYVLLPALPVPEQQSLTPIVLASDGGAVVPTCPAGPLPDSVEVPGDAAGIPAAVYQLGGTVCWRAQSLPDATS